MNNKLNKMSGMELGCNTIVAQILTQMITDTY